MTCPRGHTWDCAWCLQLCCAGWRPTLVLAGDPDGPEHTHREADLGGGWTWIETTADATPAPVGNLRPALEAQYRRLAAPPAPEDAFRAVGRRVLAARGRG